MNQRILAGTETEYGLLVEGSGAEDQVESSMALVRSYPGECFLGWDYRHESPRSDIRGFKLDRLTADPNDAKFDIGKTYGRDHEVRADRILPNGARFYNDHGHPEYSTPECWSLEELALHDCAGEVAVLRAARAYEAEIGKKVSVYKNNTDFHGSSYGSHECYLVRRSLGFEKLYEAVLPMLVVRQILTGTGKVGSETGDSVLFQISQRADFFVEPFNTETLFRRPIFNTRDEPHADPRQWMRLHVISGDANMMHLCTARKVGLVKLALHLANADSAPVWKLNDPVRTFQAISRDSSGAFKIELQGRSWTTAFEVLESYFAAAEQTLELDADMRWLIYNCRQLIEAFTSDPALFRSQVDWAAKKHMLDNFVAEEGVEWDIATLRSYDLEYHNIDPDESLHTALQEMGSITTNPPEQKLLPRLEEVFEFNRAFARSVAVKRFRNSLLTASWSSLTFDLNGTAIDVELPADKEYPPQLRDVSSVESYIELIRSVQ